MSEKSEMRSLPRMHYSQLVGFELNRIEKGAWQTIRGKGRGLDVNSTGLGFVTEIPLKAGDVLRLMVPLHKQQTTLPVFSEVRWALQERERYRVGLQFLT